MSGRRAGPGFSPPYNVPVRARAEGPRRWDWLKGGRKTGDADATRFLNFFKQAVSSDGALALAFARKRAMLNMVGGG